MIRQNRLDISWNVLGMQKSKEFGAGDQGDSIGNALEFALRTIDASGNNRQRNWWIYQKPVCDGEGYDLSEDRLQFWSSNTSSNGRYPFAVVDMVNTPTAVGFGDQGAPVWHQGLSNTAEFNSGSLYPTRLCFWPWGTDTGDAVNLDGNRRYFKNDIFGNNSMLTLFPKKYIRHNNRCTGEWCK